MKKQKKHNNLTRLLKKLKQTNKAFKKFYQTTNKNYKQMKQTIKKIWLPAMAVILCTTMSSCNVTRKVTTQSEYLQKGDTAIVIVTKTIESYDATKKGVNL